TPVIGTSGRRVQVQSSTDLVSTYHVASVACGPPCCGGGGILSSAFCKRGSVNVRFASKATECCCREASLCAGSGHCQFVTDHQGYRRCRSKQRKAHSSALWRAEP